MGRWSSEIAADCFAFVHTGFGSVSALATWWAVAAEVFRFLAGDPHPDRLSSRAARGRDVRALLRIGTLGRAGRDWRDTYDLGEATPAVRALITGSLPLLPRIVELCLRTSYRAFGGRRLDEVVDPARVRPDALTALERNVGTSLYVSPHWIHTEALRLLALYSLRFATEPERGRGDPRGTGAVDAPAGRRGARRMNGLEEEPTPCRQ